jgi:hypothetical protein
MGMEISPIQGPPATAELAKIAGVLADEAQRTSFTGDPRGTLEKAGVDLSIVPSTVVEVLSSMSPNELAAWSRLCEALVDAGFEVEPPEMEQGWGRVCFF